MYKHTALKQNNKILIFQLLIPHSFAIFKDNITKGAK